jgi:hypothetical protein
MLRIKSSGTEMTAKSHSGNSVPFFLEDGRLDGRRAMAADQIREWTAAAPREEQSRHGSEVTLKPG